MINPPDPNPVMLFIDTDALLQVLICGQMKLLRFIKKHFQIQFAVVEAVEVEIRKSKRFRAQFAGELQKAIDGATVVVIDERTIRQFVSVSSSAVFDSIQTQGSENVQNGLDYGEAYTFAAAIALDVPMISNDLSAVRTAKKRGISTPPHIFRAYDIFVLCRQSQELTENECDSIRQSLASKGEHIPSAFCNKSFTSGIGDFYARLVDGSRTSIGAINPMADLDVRVIIHPA